tara:strand:+ start:114 stop:332 length:219 start_codon:yes stop_codon:yes gene_type:complete
VAKRNDRDSVIEPLSHTSIEMMEKVLQNASESKVPIEVDGIVYYIPKPISDLIDSLAAQLDINPPVKRIDEA